MKETETYTSCMHVHVRFHIYTPQVIIRNKAVVQLHHGFGEHADRYEHFASFLANRGYVVVVSDFVGHGQSLIDFEQGYFGQVDGPNNLVKDMLHLFNVMRERYPDIPYFMLGEDLGSLLIRKFVSVHQDLIDGMILLGTVVKIDHPHIQNIYSILTKSLRGPIYKTHNYFRIKHHQWRRKVLQRSVKAAWFSSDDEERIKYLNDPMTHFVYTIQGHRDIMAIIKNVNSDEVISHTQSYLPIYLGVGENDPMADGVDRLVDKYKKAGLSDITYHKFSDRRHALLFEKNKNEIYQDILRWLEERTYL